MAVPLRGLLVRTVARNLRLGQTADDVMMLLTRKAPSLTGEQRLAIINDAIARNLRKTANALSK